MLFYRSSAQRPAQPSPPVAGYRAGLSVAAALAVLLAAGSAAWSQDTIFIGAVSPGNVQVDLSVLDELAGAPVRRSARPPAPGDSQRIVLKPPSAAAPDKTPARAAKTTKPAPAPKARATATQSADKVPPARPPAATTRAAAPPAPAPRDPPPRSPPPEIESTLTGPIPAPRETDGGSTAATAEATAPPAPAAIMAPETPGAAASIMRASEAANAQVAAAPPTIPLPPAIRSTAPQRAMPDGPSPAIAHSPAPQAAVPTADAPAVPELPRATTNPAPAQTAALASEAAAGTGKRDLRIAFSGEAAALTDPAKGEIKQLAGALAQDQALRVQVKAYASGKEDASKARRLSLSRALAVRTYLIEQGIGSTRIDVRALGNTAEDGPSDRVDLVVVTR